jgi:serine/threonine protein kinase
MSHVWMNGPSVRFWEVSIGDIFCQYNKAGAIDSQRIFIKETNDRYKEYPDGQSYVAAHYMMCFIVHISGDWATLVKSSLHNRNKHGSDMQVYLNKTPIELKQNNFLAAGGQGSVYVKGTTAYKIYLDTKKAIPRAKIKELSLLSNSNIIRPIDILENGQGEYIGYTMQFIKDTIPLCQMVPKSFKDRHNIKPDTTLSLIQQLQNLMEFVHNKDMLMIDINDLNFLVTKTFKSLYAIDVDSYQTRNYAATAIMDAIRDRHTKGFSKQSDYFSFAVTSFTTLIGLHPYRGSHPDFDKYAIKDRMNKRMESNISVFHDKISMPSACLSLDIIPQALKDWYVAVFESGVRDAPPQKYATAPRPTLKIRKVRHDSLKLSCVKKLPIGENIARLYYMNGRMFEICDGNQFMAVSSQGTPITIREQSDQTEWGDINGRNHGFFQGVTKIFNVDQHAYGVIGNKLIKLDFIENNGHIIGGIKQIGSLVGNESGSNIFQGCIIQNVLGRQIVYIMDVSSLNQIPLPELDGMVIVDAKYLNHVLVVVATDRKTQECNRYVFRLKPSFVYDVRIVKDVDPGVGVVFTISQRGVVILKNEDDQLEIFHSDVGHKDMKIVPLDKLEIDDLWNVAGDIVFTKENEIHKISL